MKRAVRHGRTMIVSTRAAFCAVVLVLQHEVLFFALKYGGLARDKLRAECALTAAPIPGIEMTAQKNTTRY